MRGPIRYGFSIREFWHRYLADFWPLIVAGVVLIVAIFIAANVEKVG